MAEIVKKTKAVAKPRKTVTTKAKAVQPPKVVMPSRTEIEALARKHWAQRGYTDGHAVQDWLHAEQQLLQMAS